MININEIAEVLSIETDELDDMDSFLTHYRAFVDKVDGYLSGSNTIALYAVYMHCNYGKVRRFL